MVNAERRAQRPRLVAAIIAALLVLASFLPLATSPAGAASSPALLRAVHAVPDIAGNPVDVYVNGAKVVTFDFFDATEYLSVRPGTYRIQVVLAGGDPKTQSVIDKKVYLYSGKAYSAIARGTATGVGAKLGMTLIQDRWPRPSGSQASIKVAHFAPDAPSVDIYANGTRVLKNLNYRGHSSYLTIPAGTYEFGVAPAGGSVIYTFKATLEGGKTYTAFANGLLSGSGAQAFKVSAVVDR